MRNIDPIIILEKLENKINYRLDVIDYSIGSVTDNNIRKDCIRYTLDNLLSQDIIQKLEKIKRLKISNCHYKYAPEIRKTVIYYFL